MAEPGPSDSISNQGDPSTYADLGLDTSSGKKRKVSKDADPDNVFQRLGRIRDMRLEIDGEQMRFDQCEQWPKKDLKHRRPLEASHPLCIKSRILGASPDAVHTFLNEYYGREFPPFVDSALLVWMRDHKIASKIEDSCQQIDTLYTAIGIQAAEVDLAEEPGGPEFVSLMKKKLYKRQENLITSLLKNNLLFVIKRDGSKHGIYHQRTDDWQMLHPIKLTPVNEPMEPSRLVSMQDFVTVNLIDKIKNRPKPLDQDDVTRGYVLDILRPIISRLQQSGWFSDDYIRDRIDDILRPSHNRAGSWQPSAPAIHHRAQSHTMERAEQESNKQKAPQLDDAPAPQPRVPTAPQGAQPRPTRRGNDVFSLPGEPEAQRKETREPAQRIAICGGGVGPASGIGSSTALDFVEEALDFLGSGIVLSTHGRYQRPRSTADAVAKSQGAESRGNNPERREQGGNESGTRNAGSSGYAALPTQDISVSMRDTSADLGAGNPAVQPPVVLAAQDVSVNMTDAGEDSAMDGNDDTANGGHGNATSDQVSDGASGPNVSRQALADSL